MNKIIEGMREAVESAKCNHDWCYNIMGTARRCPKCRVKQIDQTGQFSAPTQKEPKTDAD